ncbi:MAG: FAD-binding oxidoreductase [Actinomycetota bacterium]|nr:FAD-binding oxidoreductase [Actinomycetota bacterium]
MHSCDANRSVWLHEALAREGPQSAAQPLRDNLSVDVCIVGGGYTGLWTALNVKRLNPTTSVAVLEADICGSGASGRNGGFVMTWWSKFATLTKLCGSEAALELARRSEENVAAIGAFCRETGVPGFHQGGWLWAATNVAQVGAWKHTVDMIAAAGASPYELLSRDEVTARSGSAVHLAGIYERKAGLVQPAVLARGLASAARQLGVQIFERSPMTELHGLQTPLVRTPGGDVTAERVVLAINAWGAGLPELRRSLVVVASDVLCTEPVPDRLQQIGWGPQLSISDSRRLVNYYRLTEDGRIVFGKGGGTLALGGRVGASYNRASHRVTEVQNQLRHIYPALWDVGIGASWRGPIDYSLTGLPFFCQIAGRDDIVAGIGFSGNGVGPSYLAGQTLAKLVLEGRDESMPAALTTAPAGQLPREPLRYLGGLAVRAATARKEANEDLGRRTGPATAMLARLDPTSFVDRGSGSNGVEDAGAPIGAGRQPWSLQHWPHNGSPRTSEQTVKDTRQAPISRTAS